MIFGPETLSGRSTTDLTVFDSQQRLRRGLPIRLVVPARRDAEKQQLRHENSICGSERSYDMNTNQVSGKSHAYNFVRGMYRHPTKPQFGFRNPRGAIASARRGAEPDGDEATKRLSGEARIPVYSQEIT